MSSQKYLGRNRSPRVQIEYDLELYGVEKKVQLPFVMGVLADLLGNASPPPGPLAERQFLEVDASSLDQRMKAIQPAISITVPDTLQGDGKLQAAMAFERLEDFSPAAVARKVPALRALLEARERLSDLVTYSDGKAGAEKLLAGLLELAHRTRDERTRALGEGVQAAAEPSSDEPATARESGQGQATPGAAAAQARGSEARPAASTSGPESAASAPGPRANDAAAQGAHGPQNARRQP